MPTNEVLEAKMDNMQESINDIKSQISQLTNGIGARVEEQGKSIVRVETRIEGMESHLSAISNKIKDHIKDHWQWIGIVIGLISIAGFIFKGIK